MKIGLFYEKITDIQPNLCGIISNSLWLLDSSTNSSNLQRPLGYSLRLFYTALCVWYNSPYASNFALLVFSLAH
jgi:hypothetical protein